MPIPRWTVPLGPTDTATIALLFSLLHGLGIASAGAQTPSTDRFHAVDAYVERVMRADRTPGVAVVIVHGDTVVHVRGYGVDGYGRPVSDTTGFVLGSMSKAFTAMAIMQLVERGLVDLDAPAQKYLPWFRVKDDVASARITVRQLLHHSSGIPTRAARGSGDSLALVDHVRALAAVALTHRPGTTHQYASANYLVLGAIVEAVSGRSYAEYVERSIFTPLGMTHSFTDHDRAMRHGMARGHRYWFGYPVAATLPHESDRLPTAALISSAEDLGHFLVAQLNGGRFDATSVLAPAMVDSMHAGGVTGDGFTYAFGWRVSRIGGTKAIHHGGIVPDFRGKMVLLPEQAWGVAVLTNVSSSLPMPLTPTSHRLADDIAAHLAGQSLPASGSRHRLYHLVLLIGAVLIVAWQLLGLWRLRHPIPRAGPAPARSLGFVLRTIAADMAWVVFALVGLPGLIGLSWRELFRASPDVAWWLMISLSLTSITVAARVRAARR